MFQSPSVERMIDQVAVHVLNGMIQVKFTRNNQKPRTVAFPATDAGVLGFVDFVSKQQIDDRFSQDLARADLTPKVFGPPERLDKLVYV